MALLKINKVSLAYGHIPLLSNASFQLEQAERVCLLGRNGTGKSTLFRLLHGEAQADEGEIWYRQSLRLSYLSQEIPENLHTSVFDTVAEGLGELGSVLADYHRLSAQTDERSHATLAEIHHKIDELGGWNIQQKVESIISKLSLPADKNFEDCSGGVKRRVMLGQALVSNPDVLLLDEPTNHMDISAITWLEEFLLGFKGAIIFITHDRTLLRHLATRIIELDRGLLVSFPGNYDEYLKRKQHLLNAENLANEKFDKKLNEHEIWVRQGIKARRTRNEGRVRELQKMRDLRKQRIEQQSSVSLKIDTGEASGKRIVKLRDVSFSFGQNTIIQNFSTSIVRGDRVGIIGPNGCGKSTLIKLMLGQLKPSSGKVISGTNLEVAYFDQQRQQLDVNKSIRENITQGSDQVSIGGRSLHVISYMKNFLFAPERINSPVSSLSGGERNRLLLARIFTLPANVLVLDEPTNDLDMETLELLEELLADFSGTLLLVSHDRAFLDRVVTSVIAFEEDNKVREYVGGYEDWLRQVRLVKKKGKGDAPATSKNRPAKEKKVKLNYRESQELAALPELIESLEAEQKTIEESISQAEFYKQDKDKITAVLAKLDEVNKALAASYNRWEKLDSL